MKTLISDPKMIARRCGGWLALSPPSATIKIGVTGASEEDARQKYRDSMEKWTAASVSGEAV